MENNKSKNKKKSQPNLETQIENELINPNSNLLNSKSESIIKNIKPSISKQKITHNKTKKNFFKQENPIVQKAIIEDLIEKVNKTKKKIKEEEPIFIKPKVESNIKLKEYINFYFIDKLKLPEEFKNVPIGKWNVSNITDMSKLFENKKKFNEDISEWNVSNVTNMEKMFYNCEKFNQLLNNWNVSNVTNMKSMFENCENFNQPLNNWNVSNVTNMESMFNNCKKFNQPLNNWNVSNVTNMGLMFFNCEKFNQPLNNWNVSNVTSMESMFIKCIKFNQPLNNWNVSNVTNMRFMFFHCEKFNQPLNLWDVSNVENMESMFYGCKSIQKKNYSNWEFNSVVKNKILNSLFFHEFIDVVNNYFKLSQKEKEKLHQDNIKLRKWNKRKELVKAIETINKNFDETPELLREKHLNNVSKLLDPGNYWIQNLMEYTE